MRWLVARASGLRAVSSSLWARRKGGQRGLGVPPERRKVFNHFPVNFLLRNNVKRLDFQCWLKFHSPALMEPPDGEPV